MNRYTDPIVNTHSERGAIQAFMAQVYGWMTVGLLLTAFVAWYAAFSAYDSSSLAYHIASSRVGILGLVIAQLAVVLVLSAAINKLSAGVATALFMGYSVLNGLTLSVIFLVYTEASILNVLVTTTGTFAVMSIYGYVTKRDLTSFGNFLFMGLIGLVIASLVNLFLKSNGLSLMLSYLGVLIFVGLTAYDTQKLKAFGESVAEGDHMSYRKPAILGALTLYLDFINLFLYLLRLLGDRR